MIFGYILIFLISSISLATSGKFLVDSLSKIAKFLGWKEFVVAFLIMAFGVSLPNFFVGIISALNKIPELSFYDVIGGNIADLSLVMGISALISRMGLTSQSRTVQGSGSFTILIAILPLVLSFDGLLSRWDAFLLLIVFLIYIFWLFGKEDRFKKIYNGINEKKNLKFFLSNIFVFLIALFILLLAAQGVVKSAVFFAEYTGFSLALIGIIVVGLGNSLPELFFSLEAAKKGEDWFILGDLMGGVIITSTLVLGVVGILHPIEILNLKYGLFGRIFLVIVSLFFIYFLRTEKKITQKEGLFLILFYLIFLIVEIFVK